MSNLHARYHLMTKLAVVTLLLSLLLQAVGVSGAGMPPVGGDMGGMDMQVSCEGCDEMAAQEVDCLNSNLSCLQLPVVPVADGTPSNYPTSAERMAHIPLFHSGLNPAPELQPPQALLHA